MAEGPASCFMQPTGAPALQADPCASDQAVSAEVEAEPGPDAEEEAEKVVQDKLAACFVTPQRWAATM